VSRYAQFDRSQLRLRPLAERRNDLTAQSCIPLDMPVAPLAHPEFPQLVNAIGRARRNHRPIVCMIGAHVIKQGMSLFLIDLIRRGWISHLATNGAGIIHDFELAYQGGTSEEVAHYIKQGEFGMWSDTGQINSVVRDASARGEGLGEAVGRVIEQEALPHRHLSLCAAGWRYRVPVTCHVGIGCDIIHQHPNCDGAAFGATSYTDFLIFVQAITQLEGGVFLNIGSAVTGLEVYLKALSMARNVAQRQNRPIAHFTTAVFDLVPLPPDARDGTAPKSHDQYYYRPWKTILVRTVADGGQSFYFCADHRVSVPNLWCELSKLDNCGTWSASEVAA
jgi:hypothetical protein